MWNGASNSTPFGDANEKEGNDDEVDDEKGDEVEDGEA